MFEKSDDIFVLNYLIIEIYSRSIITELDLRKRQNSRPRFNTVLSELIDDEFIL